MPMLTFLGGPCRYPGQSAVSVTCPPRASATTPCSDRGIEAMSGRRTTAITLNVADVGTIDWKWVPDLYQGARN